MREILLTEPPDGFIIHGLVSSAAEVSAWSDPTMDVHKETYTFLDDDVARFKEEGQARRRAGAAAPDAVQAGTYESCLRVIGRYIDQQKPRDACRHTLGLADTSSPRTAPVPLHSDTS
jgi:hypothetical protein